MVSAACISLFRWQISMRCSVLYTQRIAAIILFKFESFLVSICRSAIKNEPRLSEKLLEVIKKVIFLLLFIHSKGKQIIFCNSFKSYLSPFSKFPKDN